MCWVVGEGGDGCEAERGWSFKGILNGVPQDFQLLLNLQDGAADGLF